ncbi:MAG: response regulator [Cyanophyceae cyanobacterium]
MQGKLSEIDIRSILQLIELGQRTGELFVEAAVEGMERPADLGAMALGGDRGGGQCQSWFVFFDKGQILYATSPEQQPRRLDDYLRRYGHCLPEDDLDRPVGDAIHDPEYAHLWRLIEKNELTPAQGRSLLRGAIREILFDLLSLHQGTFSFEMGPPLAPQLTAFNLSDLLPDAIAQVRAWKEFYPHLKSPNQCPILADRRRLRELLPEATFRTLTEWAEGRASIRQIARNRNRDLLTVARAILPYVQQGLIQLADPPTGHLPSDRSPNGYPQAPTIACIEDSATVRHAIEQTLKQFGYRVIAIADPIDSLPPLFGTPPDLILCDITMPVLDGYELCAMLRQCSTFRSTPIVMLTGRDGFIDRVKARVVGATDYLTKPFKKRELKTLVEKHIGPGHPEAPHDPKVEAVPATPQPPDP